MDEREPVSIPVGMQAGPALIKRSMEVAKILNKDLSFDPLVSTRYL